MLTKFWEGVGTKLVDRWAAVAVPALVFWLGGLAAFIRAHGAGSLRGVEEWLSKQASVIQVTAVVAILVGVAGSGMLVQRLTLPALRLLEGYWPQPLESLRGKAIAGQTRKVKALEEKWTKLAEQLDSGDEEITARRAYVRIDARLRRFPAQPDRIMPTRVGNTLRAAESRPVDKYGLDAVKCWSHLWLVLPETVRQELTAARARVDACVATGLWGLLFMIWTPWTWWALLAGLAVSAAAVGWWLPARADVFADLVEASFDLHRTALYRALRWPLPTKPSEERNSGEQLTHYLWRGSDADTPVFSQEKS